jgi:hypothetical protein
VQTAAIIIGADSANGGAILIGPLNGQARGETKHEAAGVGALKARVDGTRLSVTVGPKD